MIPQDLTYDLPQAAFALFAVFFILWLFWILFNYRKVVLSQFADPAILEKIMVPRSSKQYWLKALALMGGWLLCVLALMQPKGNAHYPEENLTLPQKIPQENLAKVRRRAHEVIFLIDVSSSMAVTDSRTGSSRLDFAKDIADQIASKLKGETGSLYAFTSEVAPLSPSTTDYLFLRLMIRQMRLNEGDIPGTNIREALVEMRKKYFSSPTPKLKTLVLLSDGGDTHVESLQGEPREQALNEILDLIQDAESLHLRVYTIGLGSVEGGEVPNLKYEGKSVHSAIDEEILKKIARRGRGIYYPAREYTAIALANELTLAMRQDNPFLEAQTVIQSLTSTKKDNRVFDLYYQFPLGLAILLIAYVLIWPAAQTKERGQDSTETAVKRSSGVSSFLSIVLFALFFFPFNLLSIGEDPLKEAALYVQAEEYDHAEEIYEGLLDEKPTPWQKAVLMYNLATAFLAEGKYDKAIGLFRTISLGSDPQPLLDRRLKTNLAIALLKEADGLPTDSVDALERSLFVYREAIDTVEGAIKSNCILEKAEGSPACSLSSDLYDLKIYAKEHYANHVENLRRLRIKQATLTDGIPLLLTSLKRLLLETSVVEEKAMRADLRLQYEALIVEEATDWQSLWEAIKTKMNAGDLKYKELFTKAKQEFDLGIASLKKSAFEDATKAWTNAQADLNDLLVKIFGGDTLQILLRKLLAFYNYASVQDPLQESTLSALESEQEGIMSLVKELVRQALEEAQKGLAKGYAAVQNSKFPIGKFYVVQGRHVVQSLLRKERLKPVNLPQRLLEDMIEEQHYAIALNRLRVNIPIDDKDYPNLLQQTRKAQELTVRAAEPFLPAVIDWEEKEFHKEAAGSADDRCQAHPWDEVLPLFEAGRQAALQAAGGDISIGKQEEALAKWQEALEKMRQPRASFSGSCRGGQEKREQQKNKQPAKEEKKPEKQKASMDEVLRQLIEMDQDDKLPKETQALELKVDKPW